MTPSPWAIRQAYDLCNEGSSEKAQRSLVVAYRRLRGTDCPFTIRTAEQAKEMVERPVREVPLLHASMYESLLQISAVVQMEPQRKGMMFQCSEEPGLRRGSMKGEELGALAERMGSDADGFYIIGLAKGCGSRGFGQ